MSGSFRKLGVPHFGVLMTRILLFRVLDKGPLFSETPVRRRRRTTSESQTATAAVSLPRDSHAWTDSFTGTRISYLFQGCFVMTFLRICREYRFRVQSSRVKGLRVLGR